MSAAMHQILVIFIGVLAGFICRKAKILTEEGTGTLSNIVVKIIPTGEQYMGWLGSKADFYR